MNEERSNETRLAHSSRLYVDGWPAEAARGEVCYSSAVPLTQANLLTNETTFTCPSLGQVTIPQIYQGGWRVLHLSQESLIDMNNPLSGQAAWMVLIEGP
jgi:hypothetical protein